MNNDSERDQMLRSMCQFFALTEKDKLQFLPPIKPGVTYLVNKRGAYMFNECGDRTDNPLFYYCNSALELMEKYKGGRDDEFARLIGNIYCLLNIMIGKHLECFYIWKLDPANELYGVLSSYDAVWSILRRLSIMALSERGWPREFPEVPFSETTWGGTRGPAGVPVPPSLAEKLEKLGALSKKRNTKRR